MEQLRFLTVMDIVALHEAAMEMSDQPATALVRPESLESAVAQTKQLAWYMNAEAPELSVHLATRIALAHPWVDGNKRTASLAGVHFAAINGARDPDADDVIGFANHLLHYIECDHEAREVAFAEFVAFIEQWFPG
ncbi:MAG: Fic family protein [Thermomicrobiales bacterium]|nr:Fic family protein [Thermomicrobiales bacterium]